MASNNNDDVPLEGGRKLTFRVSNELVTRGA